MRRGLIARIRALAIGLLALAVLSGCADNRPLNYRALVLTMGFSPAPHNRVTVYFQMPTPSGLTSLSSGGAASGGGGSSATTYTLHASASTVARAFTRAQANVNQDLYLGQLQAVILSTHLSAVQFADVVSTLIRLGTLDKTAYVLVTPAPMAQLFAVKSASTPLSPLYFSTEFGCAHCQTVNLKREIWNVEQAQYVPPVATLWLPVLEPGSQGFHIDTVALYRGGRMVRHLTGHQTMLLGYMLGRTGKGTVHLVWQGLPVSVRSVSGGVHLTPQWHGLSLLIRVTLNLTGDVDAFPVGTPLAAHYQWLRQATQMDLARETRILAEQLAHQGLDPWNIGAAAVWQHPSQLAVWQHAYRQSHWVVTTHVRFRELGDTT